MRSLRATGEEFAVRLRAIVTVNMKIHFEISILSGLQSATSLKISDEMILFYLSLRKKLDSNFFKLIFSFYLFIFLRII